MKRIAFIFLWTISVALQAQTVTMTRKGAPLGGNIIDIEIHPTGTVYAIVSGNGLFRSTNSGDTWARVTVSASNFLNASFNDIEIDPAGNIYLITSLTSSSAAMFLSTDNGVTWTQRTSNNPFGDINYSPQLIERSGSAANSPIYIVTNYNFNLAKQSVFRSVDNGTSWVEVYSEASQNNLVSAITSISSGSVVLLSNFKGVVRSATGTAGTFALSNTGITSPSAFSHRSHLAFAGSPARLYANLNGVFESTDAGVNWTNVTPSLPTAFSSGSGANIQFSAYGSTLQVLNAANNPAQLFTLSVPAAGAGTWTNATSTITSTQQFTRFYARSASEFYLGETAGISRSNTGTSWTFSSSGIEAIQFQYSFTNSQSLQLSGSGFTVGTIPLFNVSSDGTTWTRQTGSGLAGSNSSVFQPFSSGTWLMATNASSAVPSTSVNSNLYVSTDQGATWTPRALATGESFVNALTISGSTLYAITNTNKVYSSIDEGVTWLQVAITGLPGTFSFNSFPSFFVMNNTLYLGGFDSPSVRYYRVDLTTLAATLIPQPPAGVTFDRQSLRGFNGKLYLTSRNVSLAQLSVSSNNGTSWTTVTVPGVTGANGFLTSSGYPAYGSANGIITFTRDDGQNWITGNLGFGTETFTVRGIETDAAGLLNVLVDSRGIYQSNTAVVLPANPTNLQVVGSTFNRVVLEWDDNATNETYYRIERSIGNNTSYDSLLSGAASAFAVRNITLVVEPQTTYFYRVVAANGAGKSAYSNEISVTTPAACNTTIPDNRSWTLTTLNESGLGTRTRTNVTLSLSRLDNFQFTLGALGGNTPAWLSPNTALNTAATTLIENCGSVYIANTGNYTMNGNGSWDAVAKKLTIKWKVNRGVTSGITPFSETTELTLNPADPIPVFSAFQQTFVSVLDNTGIMVSWQQNFPYTQQIAIERATAVGGPYVEVGRVNHPETNFVDRTAGLTFGTTYFYQLRFINPAGGTLSSPPQTSVLFRKPYFAAIETVPFYPVSSKLYTSWVDINNDGFDELFYTNSNNVDRAGFIGDSGTATFTLNPFGNSNNKQYTKARFADLNNDGNIDMVSSTFDSQTNSAALEVFHGNGSGGFTLVYRSAPQAVSYTDIALYDFNGDGRLDILVESSESNIVTLITRSRLQIILNESGGNFSPGTDLYSNEDGGISDIALADYDNDGDIDIFLAGLFSTSTVNYRLLKNNGNSTFTATTIATLSINGGISMSGAAWGDIDNDGDLDLLCTYNTAPTSRALFRNDGGDTFTNLTSSPVAEPYSATTTSGIFVDVENDGDLDIIVNHQVTSTTLANVVLYLNNGAGIYTRRSGDGEFLNQSFPAKNQITAGDFNADGYMDLALGSSDRYRFVLQNNKFTTGNWLQVKLRGVASNRSGIGAQIQVVSASRTQIRAVLGQAGGALNGQHSLTQHFGLAADAGTVTVRVTWPNNRVQTVSNVSINQVLSIMEDTDGPVLSFTPLNGATDVSAGTKLDITVSETATPASGKSISVFLVSDTSTPIFTLPATTAVVTGNVFSFTLPGRLTQGSQYAVSVETGAFVDPFGNPNVAIPTTAWQFTVGTGPVLSSVSPTISATNVAVGTNIEINFDRGVTAVAGKRIRLMDGITTLANVEVTSGSISGTRFTLDPATDLPFERVIEVLLDPGAFIDGSQNEFAGFTTGQYSFTTIQAVDVTAPTIVFDSAPLASLEKGFAPVNISVTVEDNRAVTKATLFYRKSGSGSPSYSALPLTNTTSTNFWTGQVQNSFADDLGFEYFLEAEDNAPTPNKGRLPIQSNQFLTSRITFSGANRPVVNVPSGGTKVSWRIISIPHDLSTTQISEIFTELGSSGKTRWRMLQYSANTSANPVQQSWLEFPAFSNVERGKGYFINSFESKDIQLNGAVAPNFSRSRPFELSLAKGWNLIGNPYTIPLLWDDIRTFNNITSSVGPLKLFTNGTYANGNELLTMRGGFVFANDAVSNVKFSFPSQTTGGRTRQLVFEDGDWLLPIKLVHKEAENDMGGIGMHRESSLSFDGLDDLTPPAFDETLELQFDHPEHFMRYFSRDVVPTTDEYEWSFTVRTSLTGFVTLRWDASKISTTGELYLYDEEAQIPIDMVRYSSYGFDLLQGKKFKILFGRNVLENLKPARVTAGPSFPNPVQKEAIIPFALPEKNAGSRYSVHLDIFDAMGRKVETILNRELLPGFYSGIWEVNEDISEGIYFYRLSVIGDSTKEVLGGKIMVQNR